MPSLRPQIQTNRAGTAVPIISGATRTTSPDDETRRTPAFTAAKTAAHITSPGTGAFLLDAWPTMRAINASPVADMTAPRKPASSSLVSSSPR